MATYAHAAKRHPRPARISGLAIALARIAAGGVNWLLADPREVVQVSRKAGAREASHSPHEQQATGGERDSPELREELRRWRSRVQWRRIGVLVRRHLIAAAALAVVLEAFVAAGALGQLVVLTVAPAAFLIGTAIAAGQRVSLEQQARMLDERLALFDRLASGLELQQIPQAQRQALESRAIGQARALAAAGRDEWRARARPAAREWAGLCAALALLGAIAALAALHPARSASPSHHRNVIAGSAGAGAAASHGSSVQGSSHLTGTRAARSHAQRESLQAESPGAFHYNPYYRYGHRQAGTGKAELTYGKSLRSSSSVNVGHAPTERSADVGVPKPGSASKNGAAAANEANAKGFVGIGANRTSGAIAPVNAPPGSSVSKTGRTPHSAASEPGSVTPEKSGSSAQSSGAEGQSGSRRGGSPTSSATAGHQQAGAQLGRAQRTSGQAAHDLRLQAGYAPSRSSKAANGGQAADGQGGGGPGRTFTVAGGSALGAGGQSESFNYVPPDGGALAEGNASLLLSYQESLKWLQREESSW